MDRPPWRGVVVHLRRRTGEPKIRIDAEPTVKLLEFAPGDGADNTTAFDAGFEGICLVNSRPTPRRSLLKAELPDIPRTIEVLCFIRGRSAVPVSDLQAEFIAEEKRKYSQDIGDVLAFLEKNGCIATYTAPSGIRCACFRARSTGLFVRESTLAVDNERWIGPASPLKLLGDTSFPRMSGVASDPNPDTGEFTLVLPVASSSPEPASTGPQQSLAGQRGLCRVSVDGLMRDATFASMTAEASHSVRVDGSPHSPVPDRVLSLNRTGNLARIADPPLLTALDRIPAQGERVNVTVVGRIAGQTQVLLDGDKLVSELQIRVQQDGTDSTWRLCRVRAVRVRGMVYLAHNDLWKESLLYWPLNYNVQSSGRSDLSRAFVEVFKGDRRLPLTSLPSVHRELLAKVDRSLADGQFVAVSDFARSILAGGDQDDRLVWELLLC